jgi:glycosyltransferase involved in cell wall biosynthesis
VHAGASLRQWVRDNDLSVVVTSTATASALARMALRDVPVVYFCHGLHWEHNGGATGLPWKAVETLALKRTSGVITLNGEDERWFKRHAPGLPLVRLPYGVGIDPATYPRTSRRIAGTTRLCWIGEFSARKNPSHAVRVADALRRRGATFHLDMLGSGSQFEATQRLVRDLGLEDHVALHGHQPVQPFIESADALMHTAKWEGLPRVFLETLATGRRVFSYDIKGARDIPCATLTPYGDVAAMAEGLARFARDAAPDTEGFPPIEHLSYASSAHEIARFVEAVCSAGGERA